MSVQGSGPRRIAASLDQRSLVDPRTGEALLGIERVNIVCAECGGTVVGKVFSGADRTWLTSYRRPAPMDVGLMRIRNAGRWVPRLKVAGATVIDAGAGRDRDLWCEKHGRRTVSGAVLTEAIERSCDGARVVRVSA